jgi:hypothetical protein
MLNLFTSAVNSEQEFDDAWPPCVAAAIALERVRSRVTSPCPGLPQFALPPLGLALLRQKAAMCLVLPRAYAVVALRACSRFELRHHSCLLLRCSVASRSQALPHPWPCRRCRGARAGLGFSRRSVVSLVTSLGPPCRAESLAALDVTS